MPPTQIQNAFAPMISIPNHWNTMARFNVHNVCGRPMKPAPTATKRMTTLSINFVVEKKLKDSV